MDGAKYTKYRALYDRLYRSCREIVSADGLVKMVSLKRIAVFLRGIGTDRVDSIVGRIRERFMKMVKKEGMEKLGLGVKKVPYEKDRAGLYKFLTAIY